VAALGRSERRRLAFFLFHISRGPLGRIPRADTTSKLKKEVSCWCFFFAAEREGEKKGRVGSKVPSFLPATSSWLALA